MDREFLVGLQLPEEAVEAILQQHEKDMGQLRLEGALENAVVKAGGRCVKAIRALLEPEDWQDPAQAVERLKKEHGYLFQAPVTQAYAPGPGTAPVESRDNMTLAGALRTRMGM